MQLNVFGHLAVFAALVVNLWLGGDLVEAWGGRYVRHAAEFLLILGYAWIVLGIRAPLPWQRREGPAEGQGDDDGAPPSAPR